MSDVKRKYMVATDVGGTCTDTIVFAAGEPAHLGKTLSTPPDFSIGVMDSIRSAADAMGISLADLLAQTSLFMHGSTVVDNTILTRDGARTGLITTRGFEDTVLMTRGAYGRWGGLTEDRIKHPVKTERAPPLVDPDCIVGVPERTDYKGAILQELDEAAAEAAIRFLIDEKDVEALAVSFLWSFYNAGNERKVSKLVERIAPGLYCTLSSEIAPIPGEYERSSTTVINAYAGRITKNYLNNLQGLLAKGRLCRPGHGDAGLWRATSGTGSRRPLDRHAGMRARCRRDRQPGARTVARPARRHRHRHGRHDLQGRASSRTARSNTPANRWWIASITRQPKIEVVSIGSGGGSIVWLEQGTNTPRVGPRSAGARPGPICYGLGGTEPTMTDVFMLIGYMDPNIFLGGTMRLDPARARRIFDEKIAQPLGMSVEEAAFGIYRVATAQISDLIHEITVERGLDPRDFVLHAFGGSCGIVAGMFGAELKVKRMVIPYTASVNCAFGLVSADIVHEYSQTTLLPVPSPPQDDQQHFQADDRAGTQPIEG